MPRYPDKNPGYGIPPMYFVLVYPDFSFRTRTRIPGNENGKFLYVGLTYPDKPHEARVTGNTDPAWPSFSLNWGYPFDRAATYILSEE